MKPISRKLLTATAAASLIALTGCGMGAPSVEEPPKLSEIDDLMWDTMAEEGSVTLSTDLDTLTDGQGDEMFSQMFGDDASINIYGPLDGTATAVSIGDSDLMRVFGQEEAFLSGDALFMMFDGQSMGMDESQQAAIDAAAEDFTGTWIDFSSELSDSDDFNLGTLFADLKEDWNGGEDAAETPIDKNEISDEGTHEVRDDIDVWVYTGEDGEELVLVADHDAPKFYEFTDGDMFMKFLKWGETESPERPADENVITQDEAQQQIMESMMSAAMGQ